MVDVSNIRAVAPDVVEVEYERSDITERLGLRVRIERSSGDALEEAGRMYEEDLGEPLGSALEELEPDHAGRHWWESSQSKWSGELCSSKSRRRRAGRDWRAGVLRYP